MKFPPEKLQNFIKNIDKEINNHLFFNYDQIDFELLNQIVDELCEQEKGNNEISNYLLSLSVLCKSDVWLKRYLENKDLIKISANNTELVNYLIEHNEQPWCLYKTIELMLAYGKHWDLFAKAPEFMIKDNNSQFTMFFNPLNNENKNKDIKKSILHTLIVKKQYTLINEAFDAKIIKTNSFIDSKQNTIFHVEAESEVDYIISCYEKDKEIKQYFITNIEDKNIWQVAAEQSNFEFITKALKIGMIKYNEQLKTASKTDTIFHYLMATGNIGIINAIIDTLKIAKSNINKSVWLSAVTSGYFNAVFDAAEKNLFDSKTTTYNESSTIWCELLNAPATIFKDFKTSNKTNEKYEILINAMQNGLCDINLFVVNFLTKKFWDGLDEASIITLKNNMILAMSKFIKEEDFNVYELLNNKWNISSCVNEYKLYSSIYILSCSIVDIKDTLKNSNPSLSYAILFNITYNDYFDNILKTVVKEILKIFIKNQLLDKLEIDHLFWQTFLFNIESKHISIAFENDDSDIILLNKLIDVAPSNNDQYMEALGDAILEYSESDRVKKDESIIHNTWHMFAEKYSEVFTADSQNQYKSVFLSKSRIFGAPFSEIFNLTRKRSLAFYDDPYNTNELYSAAILTPSFNAQINLVKNASTGALFSSVTNSNAYGNKTLNNL